MDMNAGWEEGTCAECGACYQRSIIRPALCPCGAELCGHSRQCLLIQATWTCSLSERNNSEADDDGGESKEADNDNFSKVD